MNKFKTLFTVVTFGYFLMTVTAAAAQSSILKNGKYGSIEIFSTEHAVLLDWTTSNDETDGGYACTGFTCRHYENEEFVISILGPEKFRLKRLDNGYSKVFTLTEENNGPGFSEGQIIVNGRYGNVSIYSRGEAILLDWSTSNDETDGSYTCSAFTCKHDENDQFVITVMGPRKFRLRRLDNGYTKEFKLSEETTAPVLAEGEMVASGKYGNVSIFSRRHAVMLDWTTSNDETDGSYACKGFVCKHVENDQFVISILGPEKFRLKRLDNGYVKVFTLTEPADNPNQGDQLLVSGRYGNVSIYARGSAVLLDWTTSNDETDGAYLCTGFTCFHDENEKFMLTVLGPKKFQLKRLDNGYVKTFTLTDITPNPELQDGEIIESGRYGNISIYSRRNAIMLDWTTSHDETDGPYSCIGFTCKHDENDQFIISVLGADRFRLRRLDNGYSKDFSRTGDR